MKLTTTTFVSDDGVTQGISGRDEDRNVQVAAGREAHREWADEAPENRVRKRDEAPG